jgi:hypothetical protein
MNNKISKEDLIKKIKAGSKIVKYKVDSMCIETYPCIHSVHIELEDGSSADVEMRSGSNILNDKNFHQDRDLADQMRDQVQVQDQVQDLEDPLAKIKRMFDPNRILNNIR